MANRKTLNNYYLEYNYRYDNRSPYYVDLNTYKKILLTLFKNILEAVIFHGFKYELPNNVGEIYIRRFKPNNKKKFIDFGTSNKIKKKLLQEGKTPKSKENPDGEPWIVYYNNYHTNGYTAEFYWDIRNVRLKNKHFYKMEPIRSTARYLSKCLKENNLIHKYING